MIKFTGFTQSFKARTAWSNMVRPRWGDVIVDGWPPIGSTLTFEALRRAFEAMSAGSFKQEYMANFVRMSDPDFVNPPQAPKIYGYKHTALRMDELDWLRYAPLINTGGS